MFVNQGIKAVRGEASWDPCVLRNKLNVKQKAASIEGFQKVIRKQSHTPDVES